MYRIPDSHRPSHCTRYFLPPHFTFWCHVGILTTFGHTSRISAKSHVGRLFTQKALSRRVLLFDILSDLREFVGTISSTMVESVCIFTPYSEQRLPHVLRVARRSTHERSRYISRIALYTCIKYIKSIRSGRIKVQRIKLNTPFLLLKILAVRFNIYPSEKNLQNRLNMRIRIFGQTFCVYGVGNYGVLP